MTDPTTVDTTEDVTVVTEDQPPATDSEQPETETTLARLKKADLIALILARDIPVPDGPDGGEHRYVIEAALQALHRIADALEDGNRLKRAELTVEFMHRSHYPYVNDARYREAAHAIIGDIRAYIPAEG